jgi:cell division protein FtsQ
MDRSFAVRLGRPRPIAIGPLAIALPRRPGMVCLAALAVLAMLFGLWTWLRDSPLVSVEHVRITGVHGTDAAAIESALARAARTLTTMDAHPGPLTAAVAPYKVVREVLVHPSFPHGLHIIVVEQPPVAALTMGSTRTAVAADGVVLGPGFLSSSLPVIRGALPAVGAQHVQGASLLAELAVLGGAPEALIGWVSRVYEGHNGITVAMRNGLLLYFGDAARPHAKWLSAARVLSDPSSAGASYIDVRLPERPAAGMSGSAASISNSTAAEAGQVSASDPTAAALAAALQGAVSGGSSATSTSGTTSTQTSVSSTTSESATGTAPASGSGTTTTPSAGSEAPSSGTAEVPATPSETR